MTDFYSTLGVSRNASQDDIKKAYRKLAATHHPDRGGDTKKFQEVQAAYETLSDTSKRQQYDNPQPQGFEFHGAPPGFEDIFAHFGGGGPFGFNFQFGHGSPRPPQKNRTLNMQAQINLKDALTGTILTSTIILPSGREQTIEVKIPAGIQDGTTLRLAGMGDDAIPSLPKGDIHLTVQIVPEPGWTRHGDDLIKQLTVDALDAILGRVYIIDTLDGRKLEVTVPPGTQPNHMLSLPGYGMPNMNDPRFVGRILLEIKINIPTNLSEAHKNLLRQIVS
jgi:curved DNA-binding protein